MVKEKKEEDKKKDELTELTEQMATLAQRMKTAEEAKEQEASKKTEAEKLIQQQELEARANLEDLLDKAASGAEDDDTSKSKKGVEDLTNREMLDVMSRAVETAMQAKSELGSKASDAKIAELGETVNGLRKVLMQMHARAGVDAARRDHDDFDDYGDDIANILNDYPNLDIDAAYILAKGKRAGKSPSQKQTFSERPTDSPSRDIDIMQPRRREGSREREDATETRQRKSGTVGFRGFMNDALDKVLANRDFGGRE